MTSSLGNSVQELSGLGLGGEVARGPGERGDARAVAARAVQARWRAGRLGRSCGAASYGGAGCAGVVAHGKARVQWHGEAGARRCGREVAGAGSRCGGHGAAG